MRIALRTACALVLLLPTPAIGKEVGDLVVRLSSPFEETRQQAAESLARLGAAADPALLELYPRADFRTKALVLEVYAREARPAALPVLLGDLDCPDRGVVIAQRRYVSALYGAARDFARTRVVPLLGNDWEKSEATLALPGPGKTPRAVLAALEASPDSGLAANARALAKKVKVVDDIRSGLARVEKTGSPLTRQRARAIGLLLLRHDTERAFLAVQQARTEGMYEGMFSLAGELALTEKVEGVGVVSVLLRIVKDQPFPEAGVPPGKGRGYEMAEPVPLDIAGEDGVRLLAAECLADVARGRLDVGRKLADYYANGCPVPETIFDTPLRHYVALACASMGVKQPLLEEAADLEASLRRNWSREVRRIVIGRLGACYLRLGRYEDAVKLYQEAIRFGGAGMIDRYNLACALTKLGRKAEALDQLAAAVEEGYGDDPAQVVWLERDGDLAPLRGTTRFREIVKRAQHPNR